MKTLLLMRHAKSSWKDSDLPDFDRPLNKRGEKDAPRMGKLIKKEKLFPDLILSSPAVRAKATTLAVVDKIDYDDEVVYLDSLYLGEPENYFRALLELSDDVDRVLVVGHNPGLETVLQIMCGKVESLPTGAIAYLQIPIRKWKVLNSHIDVHLVKIWRPKDLK